MVGGAGNVTFVGGPLAGDMRGYAWIPPHVEALELEQPMRSNGEGPVENAIKRVAYRPAQFLAGERSFCLMVPDGMSHADAMTMLIEGYQDAARRAREDVRQRR